MSKLSLVACKEAIKLITKKTKFKENFGNLLVVLRKIVLWLPCLVHRQSTNLGTSVKVIFQLLAKGEVLITH